MLVHEEIHETDFNWLVRMSRHHEYIIFSLYFRCNIGVGAAISRLAVVNIIAELYSGNKQDLMLVNTKS